ncbi:hypothetical protein GCM10008941_38330 [Rhizomicrobium palustre]
MDRKLAISSGNSKRGVVTMVYVRKSCRKWKGENHPPGALSLIFVKFLRELKLKP